MTERRGAQLTPHYDGWAIQREGGQRASSVHRTRADAGRAGREAARRDHVEFYLHGRNGRIRRRESHGDDPCLPSRVTAAGRANMR
jgi:hypothetical protein